MKVTLESAHDVRSHGSALGFESEADGFSGMWQLDE
jgi:hypothetical protein